MFRIRLKIQREKKKMSQRQLAEYFNLTQSAVGNWESGRSTPDYQMLKKLATFFGVTTDYLLGIDNSAPDSLSDRTENEIFRALQNLTPENKEEVLRFIQFIHSKQE